jgi:hypothetical protein
LDLDQQVGAPRTWKFAGRDWKVAGLTFYQIGLLTAWLKDNVPSPRERLVREFKTGVFSAEERAEMLLKAAAAEEKQYDQAGRQTAGWPPSIDSPEAQEYLFQGTGIPYFLWVILRRHQPDLTLEEAEKLAWHVEPNDLAALCERIGFGGGEQETPEPLDPDRPEYVDPKG